MSGGSVGGWGWSFVGFVVVWPVAFVWLLVFAAVLGSWSFWASWGSCWSSRVCLVLLVVLVVLASVVGRLATGLVVGGVLGRVGYVGRRRSDVQGLGVALRRLGAQADVFGEGRLS